ncbi:MAG: hypothetical protein WAR21_08910, partial [Candidatus Acidiferrales bacterium]
MRIFFRENQAFEKKGEEGLMRIEAIGEEPNRKETCDFTADYVRINASYRPEVSFQPIVRPHK